MATSVTDINCSDLCDCLLHPFQNDPGVSQQQRLMEELLGGKARIDARKTADLLDYFYRLSGNINYYDANLVVSDWAPFFEKSAPFALAALIKYNSSQVKEKFSLYKQIFEKKPTAAGLQLVQFFIFYSTVKKIGNWYLTIKGSGLPVERVFESIIKDKLRRPLLSLFTLNRLASRWFCVKQIDFLAFFEHNIWGLDSPQKFAADAGTEEESFIRNGACDQLKELYERTIKLFPTLHEPIKILATAAELSLEESILPLKEDLQKKHLPHLGLLFAFLKLFEKLQGDLNSYTKKHLDFFYKQVLKLKPEKAVPDQVHIVFEIQKELDRYLLEKGLLVKDGKDINKEEILYSLNDEIVVNQAQVKDTRTLFLNNQTIIDPVDPSINTTLIEGAYIATDATKADGVVKDFQTEIKNFYTVGNKDSKYLLPGTKVFKPYQNARLGFILASPVLLLREGTRKVTISLQCRVDENVCDDQAALNHPASKRCCEEHAGVVQEVNAIYPNFYKPTASFYNDLELALNSEYYYVSQELIAEAVKKGLSKDLADFLRGYLITSNNVSDPSKPRPYTYCPIEQVLFDTIVEASDFEAGINITIDVVQEFFKKRKPFSLSFSGEKDWIEPGLLPSSGFTITVDPANNRQFTFRIVTTLNPDKDPVTFYDKEKLKEDFDTTLPLVKIELDDKFKLFVKYILGENEEAKKCCLRRDQDLANNEFSFSLYHFFKNVKVIHKLGADPNDHNDETQITVEVCGLRNFIIQNGEALQDVNGPVYPFSALPTLGSNFYIGSKEVFFKQWEECWININWKDRPNNFEEYYPGYQNKIPPEIKITDFKNENFVVKKSVLNEGDWLAGTTEQIFPAAGQDTYGTNTLCAGGNANYKVHLKLLRGDYANIKPVDKKRFQEILTSLNVNSRNGFVRLSLNNISTGTHVDFQHSNYSFILARQMMAFGKLPKRDIADGAVYYDTVGLNIKVLSTNDLLEEYKKAKPIAVSINKDVNNPPPLSNNPFGGVKDNAGTLAGDGGNPIASNEADNIRHILEDQDLPNQDFSLSDGAMQIEDIITKGFDKLDSIADYAAIIPNEPWTPIISGMSIDYKATAVIKDIDLIHLYPFRNTFKHEEIELEPTLFPTFCDEGTLFLGLEKLVPGNNLNILFQLAEATADSESDPENVYWYYLDGNSWRPLRAGFEVLEDATENLTTSGIIKFALPENMTKDNTVMPAGLHWIKATIPKNSRSVSETTGIHAQAIKVIFTNRDANDKLRLDRPIEAGQIAKLNEADASVKKVSQPYESFGGQVPEEQRMFYIGVSELLRHKGRAIQKFDYERLVLDAFPAIFKAKCINHSFGLNAHLYKNDFPYAPGFVIMAVIPDLFKLKAGNTFEPKVPVSLLEKIDDYIRRRTSTFVKFRSMNPRYEKIHLSVKVKLVKGKDENYFKEKLVEDIREFLAPWAVGEYHKIAFGECIRRSDLVHFMESRDYIDFILQMNMRHEMQATYDLDAAGVPIQQTEICPKTPRSILIAGNVEVCIEKQACGNWEMDEKCDHQKIKLINYCEQVNE
jgi:hypothetical protein